MPRSYGSHTLEAGEGSGALAASLVLVGVAGAATPTPLRFVLTFVSHLRGCPTEMSSRPLLIAGIVGGVVVGVGLFALSLALVAISGAALGGSMMAMVVLATALGLVLDATWLTLAVDRLGKLDRSEGEEGEGWHGPEPDPAGPGPSSDNVDWWPEFERELSAYLETRERSPVSRRRSGATERAAPPGR